MLLHNPAIPDEVSISLLMSLSTIIKDSRIHFKVKQFDHLLQSKNSMVEECMKYIRDCLIEN